jgi:hypothetical protein
MKTWAALSTFVAATSDPSRSSREKWNTLFMSNALYCTSYSFLNNNKKKEFLRHVYASEVVGLCSSLSIYLLKTHTNITERITSYLFIFGTTFFVFVHFHFGPIFVQGRGSIPDEIIGFFSWPNPSSCTMVLGSTQPLTEMSTRNLPGGKGWPARKADKITAICEPIV